MSRTSSKKPPQLPSMRRVCRIVADVRGNGSVEWLDASPDCPSPTVELRTLEAGLALAPEKLEEPQAAYDPYSNPTAGTRKKAATRRTDLRQLSEWIKAVREVKETQGGDDSAVPPRSLHRTK